MGQQDSHLPGSAACHQAPRLGLTHTLLYSQDLLKFLCSYHMPSAWTVPWAPRGTEGQLHPLYAQNNPSLASIQLLLSRAPAITASYLAVFCRAQPLWRSLQHQAALPCPALPFEADFQPFLSQHGDCDLLTVR